MHFSSVVPPPSPVEACPPPPLQTPDTMASRAAKVDKEREKVVQDRGQAILGAMLKVRPSNMLKHAPAVREAL